MSNADACPDTGVKAIVEVTPVAVAVVDDNVLEKSAKNLVMDPVLIGPAEHELDDVTTENVFDAALSVVLKVTPVIIIN